MPRYKFVAKTKDAKTIKDAEEAPSWRELASRLRARGLFVVAIKEAKEKKEGRSSFFSLSFSKKGKRASLKLYDLTLFARSLSTTLSSGVTLTRSLDILAAQTESVKLDKILKECSKDIKEGLSLSKAISKHPKTFSSLWQGIIEIGEVSGNLPFVLGRLADYLEMRMEFTRKVKSALVYPTILTVAAIGAIAIFFKVILPKFTVLFKQFNMELPFLTKVVFGISRFLETKFLLIAAVLTILIIIAGIVMRKKKTRRLWDKVSLKLPILGKFLFLSYIERVVSTIYILLESGVPVVYALEIAAKAVGNYFFESILTSIKDRVGEGASLSGELAKTEIFPLLISEMAKIGEETGSMADVFNKISLHYQKELSTRVERFISAFEPLMIVFMGVIIGTIVISLFLPLFKVATVGGQ